MEQSVKFERKDPTEDFMPGDTIKRMADALSGSGGGVTYHYGIYIGNREVINKYDDGALHKDTVGETWMKARYGSQEVADYAIHRYNQGEAVHGYGNMRKDRFGYHFILNNCEHFVRDCELGEDGKGSSYQVNCAIAILIALVVGIILGMIYTYKSCKKRFKKKIVYLDRCSIDVVLNDEPVQVEGDYFS